MVHVYYTSFDEEWPSAYYNTALSFFSVEERAKYSKFVRWQDRQSGVLGKLLLWHGLKKNSFRGELSDLIFNKYGKPFFKEGPHFNITHAGNYVVCAIADSIEIGIDIEKINAINAIEFKSVFTAEEHHLLRLHKNDASLFYELWTKKEAVVKAEGSGLSIPLTKVNTITNPVLLSEKAWYLSPIEIHKEYKCHVATDAAAEISLTSVDYLKIIQQ